MNDPGHQPAIEPGWDVRDVDGELVGTVIEATESYVLVEQGRFFPDDVYIPREAVAGVMPGAVTLNLNGQAALDAGWHAGPPVGVGPFSTENLAPGIAIAGQVDELGTTEDDVTNNQEPSAGRVFQPAEVAYIERQLLGRLATVSTDGEPHVVPFTHRYNRALETIDVGGRDFRRSKTYQNVAATARVAYVIDDLDERLVPRGLEIRGRGELHPNGGRDIDPSFDDELLRVHPEHIAQWGLTPRPE
jgi:pyridoxamine 5'-phosphate oxidase family protein